MCVKGNIYGDNDFDYYGIVEEILSLLYLGNLNKVFILQYCKFDLIIGVNVNERYGIAGIWYKIPKK